VFNESRCGAPTETVYCIPQVMILFHIQQVLYSR